MSSDRSTPAVRPAAVAGSFYPAVAEALRERVRELLVQDPRPDPDLAAPKALIVPHAGYIYSGPIAARAYRRLACTAGIERVVLLGPAHRAPVRGLAVPECSAFSTPLGTVPLDAVGMAAALAAPQVCRDDTAHALEHSLEVQLPFLQAVLGDIRLVALAVGDATAQEVAEVIERLYGGAETLIVVSSDLSHYLPYAQACRIDEASAQEVLALRPSLGPRQACGAAAINGLLLAARRRGLRPELLDLRNSGDTAGDRSRVVGYAAFAFTENGHGPH